MVTGQIWWQELACVPAIKSDLCHHIPAIKYDLCHHEIASELTDEQRQAVTNLLKYEDVFTDIPTRTTVIEHKIVLTTGASIRVKPYRMSLHFRNQISEEIQELLRFKIWHNLQIRLGVLFITITRGKRRTSQLDCAFTQNPNSSQNFIYQKGSYQFPVENQSRQYTAFQTFENTCIFNFLRFVLSNSPPLWD